MAFKLDIDFDVPPNLVLPSEKAHRDVLRAQYKYLQGAGHILRGHVLQKTPFAFGNLRNSIMPFVKIKPDGIEGGVATACPYALYVEKGTRPHWPPIASLKLWALRKFGDLSIAYIAQKAIARRGTKGKFMFLYAKLKAKSRLNAMAERMRDRIIQAWAKK